MQKIWLKIKQLFQQPKSRYKAIFTIIGAITLVLVVLFSGGIDNLLKIFGPRALNFWTTQTSLVDHRAEGATVQIKRNGDTYLYALGGLQKTGSDSPIYLKSVEYAKVGNDGATGDWRFAKPMISERAGLRAVAYDANSDGNDDYIYAVAGDFHIPPSGSFGPWKVEKSNLSMSLASYLASKNTGYNLSQWQQLIESGAVSLFLGTGGVQGFSVPSANEYISGSSSKPIVPAKKEDGSYWNWEDLPRDVWRYDGVSGRTLDLQLSVFIGGESEPLPYSTVERLNLNTGHWEPVSILTDVNYYPEVAIVGGKLLITGGVYGKLFEAKEAGDFTSSWGTFNESLGSDTGDTGTGTGTGTGSTTEPVTQPTTPTTQPTSPSIIGLLRQFFNLDSAFAQVVDPNIQKDIDVWSRFSNLPKVGKGFLYLPNPAPTWNKTTWVSKVVIPAKYEWRVGKKIIKYSYWAQDGSDRNGGGYRDWVKRDMTHENIYIYQALVQPEYIETIISYPAPDPEHVYSQALINGSFWTTTSIAYAYDLTTSTWTAGELSDTTAYSSYTTIDNLNGKFVKVGAIRLDIGAFGGGAVAPRVSLAPLAQGRYGHQMVHFGNSVNAASGTYIFGGASVGSGRYTKGGWEEFYAGTSPFWAIEGTQPVITTDNLHRPYQYTAPVSLTLGGANWAIGNSTLAFKDTVNKVQGRAFHQIIQLTGRENSLLAVGGLVNNYITATPASFKAVPTSQVYQLTSTTAGWATRDPLAQAVYSPAVMSLNDQAIVAGGAIDFPSQPYPQSTAYWPNYAAKGTGATYIWDNNTWTSSGSMINHGNLLGYSFASVSTKDPTNIYNYLYILGGLNPVSKATNDTVENFQLSAINPQEFSATNSTIEVSDSPAKADGTDTATIIITLKDYYNNPITSGRYKVGLMSYNPPNRLPILNRTRDIVVGDEQVPNTEGKVTFRVKSNESTAPSKAYFKPIISDTKLEFSFFNPGLQAEVEFIPDITLVEPNFIQPGKSVVVDVYANGTHFSDTERIQTIYTRGTNVRLTKIVAGIMASATPNIIQAKTSSQSTVTVRLTNNTGGPDHNKTVSLSVEGGGTISPSSITTDARGEATAVYTSDTTPGLARIRVSGGGYTSYTFVAKTSPFGSAGYTLSVGTSPAQLVAGSNSTSVVTATYLLNGSPVPGETIKLYVTPPGNTTKLIELTGQPTDIHGKTTFDYQATNATGTVQLAAIGQRDGLPVVGFGNLHQIPNSLTNTVTVSNIDALDSGRLKFTATAPANLNPGEYILTVESYLRDNLLPPRTYWLETVSYPFSVISTTSGILSYQPKESDRGKTIEDFIIYGGDDTSFLLGSTEISFTPVGTSPSPITAVVKSVPNSHKLHAQLTIPNTALVGYWNFKVKTTFQNGTVKEWMVAGDTDFKVTEPLSNLLDLNSSTVSAVPRYVPTSDGSTVFSRVTVTLRDKDFNGLSGRLVSIESSQTDDEIVAVNDITDAKGRAMFKVSSTSAHLSTITATSEGITIGDVEIQFENKNTTTLIPVTLSIKVPLQANVYDQQVKLYLLEKTTGQKPTIDESYFTNLSDIITEPELPRMYLHKDKGYTLWAKGRYHLARVREFNAGRTSGATISIDFTETTAITAATNPNGGLLIGDFGGVTESWVSGFRDNKINMVDFWLPLGNWGSNRPHPIADINKDAAVNTFDLGFLTRNYGLGAPLP